MKYYLVYDDAVPTQYAVIGCGGFVPQNYICEVPASFHTEDPRCIVVENGVARIDEELRLQYPPREEYI